MDLNLGRSNRFFSSANVQTGSGALSASCSMGILFLGEIKRPGVMLKSHLHLAPVLRMVELLIYFSSIHPQR